MEKPSKPDDGPEFSTTAEQEHPEGDGQTEKEAETKQEIEEKGTSVEEGKLVNEEMLGIDSSTLASDDTTADTLKNWNWGS